MGDFSDRRAQRRWQRRTRRRMKALDREYGPMRPVRAKPRRQHGPVLPGLAIALIVTTLLLLRDPGATGFRMRELLHLGQDRLAGVVDAPEGRGVYAFSMTQPGSEEPVSYNPCRPIRYVVNPDGAPEDGDRLVEEAVATISSTTGFEFEDDGTSDDRAFEDRTGTFGRASPVLIGWATEDEVPRLEGDVAGLGGSAAAYSAGRRTYVTGMVVLDSDAFDDMDGGAGGYERQLAVVTHELAHVVGLAHVDDPDELMYAESLGRTTLGPGDLEGLARLGAVPCG